MPDLNEDNSNEPERIGTDSDQTDVVGTQDAAAAKAAQAHLPKIISFDSLARCGDEIWIENGGQIYRLRRTRQGKLILTK